MPYSRLALVRFDRVHSAVPSRGTVSLVDPRGNNSDVISWGDATSSTETASG